MNREMLLSKVFRAHQKVGEGVFDESALFAVYKLVNSGSLEYLNGVVGTGKESKVYWGVKEGEKDVAVKVYSTFTTGFKNRKKYVLGDPRFEGHNKGSRKLIYTWARKEYSNLLAAHNAQIPVPKPLDVYRNVLIMDFIGENGVPAPTIRRTGGGVRDYKRILNLIRILFRRARLVHADLSEFNLFKRGRNIILFDFGSAVDISHPSAESFLRKDLENVNRFFAKQGVEIISTEKAFASVKGDEF